MAGMDYKQIIGHWGGVEAARQALGVRSRQTIYNWKEKGVPLEQQIQAEVKSGGVLKADIPDEVRS